MELPKKVARRLREGIHRFQPVVRNAKSRDVAEADTVVIVTDFLAEVLGYDKYTEVTREFAIHGTKCDLAIKIDNKPKFLVEVKAIGLELRDAHVKQAIDYAANLGVDWAALTNGVEWHVYRIIFGKPITRELVLHFSLSDLNSQKEADLEVLYPIAREGLLKGALKEYHEQKEAMSRFSLAALLLSEPILKALRRELRRLSPGVNVDIPNIEQVLRKEVLKREVVEDEKAKEAQRKIRQVMKKQASKAKAQQKELEPLNAPHNPPEEDDQSELPEMP